MSYIRLAHCLPPETAHNLGLWALRRGLLPGAPPLQSDRLKTNAFGLGFANPVGLAAGFDKNAVAVNGLFSQGFGFVEAGTVTPLPQPGNPGPRIFRLREDAAVINRLGFNNDGLAAYLRHLRQVDKSRGVVGANIGKNKASEDAVADYVTGLQAVYPYADYVTLNISSPNTQGLRALQQRDSLEQLLSAMDRARGVCVRRYGMSVPLLLKVAPDLNDQDIEDIAEISMQFGLDGIIVSNTTITRPASLRSEHASQAGGLSGKPLFELANDALKSFYTVTGGRIPLVGVGGVATAHDAYMKIRAGATLLQLYTALVYKGFGVVREIQTGLIELLARDGYRHVSEAVGADIHKG
jgi:dihydroorotate dehydrogenase